MYDNNLISHTLLFFFKVFRIETIRRYNFGGFRDTWSGPIFTPIFPWNSLTSDVFSEKGFRLSRVEKLSKVLNNPISVLGLSRGLMIWGELIIPDAGGDSPFLKSMLGFSLLHRRSLYLAILKVLGQL